MYWVLVTPPPRQEYARRRHFFGVVAAWLGNAMHVLLIVLVAAIMIALDDGDSGNQDRTY